MKELVSGGGLFIAWLYLYTKDKDLSKTFKQEGDIIN